MPSRAYQGVIIWGKKKEKRDSGKALWIAAKTGYVNVTIGERHFYYNRKEVIQAGQEGKIPYIALKHKDSKERQTIVVVKRAGW